MHVLSKDELEALARQRSEICISIYMPTARAGAEAKGNRVMLKTLVGRAEGLLGRHSLRQAQVDELLGPIRTLGADAIFWQHQSDGFALFRSRQTFRHFRLPVDFEELVTVDRRFHLAPLLRLLTGEQPFFVLALSQNQVRLLDCTRSAATEISVRGMPKDMAEALAHDDPESQLQFHTGASAGTGRRPAIYHGHGVGVDDKDTNLRRFLGQVGHAVDRVLGQEKAPLVLAGVEYLQSIYREMSAYPHLVEDGLAGNPDDLNADQLRDRAWEKVASLLRRSQEEATEQYRVLEGTARASTDVRDVLIAAHHGRIRAVFLARDAHLWGDFDAATGEVDFDNATEGGEDLLDLAAMQTFVNGGAVHVLDPDQMLSPRPLAAVFRY